MSMVKRAVALGFFDGVHIGHAALMRRLLEMCGKTGLTPAVITFDKLPQNLIDKKNIPLINSPQDRAGLIKRLFGIDEVISLHFDKAMASMPWDEFVDYIVINCGVWHIIVGSNFKFGIGAKGNSLLLERKCFESGLGCDIIGDVTYNGIVSSSTYIRKLLVAGDLKQANTYLGHPHVLTDFVRSGQRLGGSLGTPTLNMHFATGVLIPAHGVYATKVYLEDNTTPERLELPGVTNIGVRPTVENSGIVTAETHIPGFEKELYGCNVRIEFHSYLRPEMKFPGINELKAQIAKDCKAAMEFFGINNES